MEKDNIKLIEILELINTINDRSKLASIINWYVSSFFDGDADYTIMIFAFDNEFRIAYEYIIKDPLKTLKTLNLDELLIWSREERKENKEWAMNYLKKERELSVNKRNKRS